MKKLILKVMPSLIMVFVLMSTISSCHGVRPDADEESVLIKKPWFFGHGGVDNEPVETGCAWCVCVDDKFGDIQNYTTALR